MHTAVSRLWALPSTAQSSILKSARSIEWSSNLTCFCNNSSVLLVEKKQQEFRRQRHKTHSASQTLLARAARARQRLGGRVSALGLNGGLDSFTHHPEPEEVEESWALESGDSHGRLPFRASGRRDVDLGQNHSTETQPSPPTHNPEILVLEMHVQGLFRITVRETIVQWPFQLIHWLIGIIDKEKHYYASLREVSFWKESLYCIWMLGLSLF